eukprot:3623853-Lingulodinium_polyedra.AAC.1
MSVGASSSVNYVDTVEALLFLMAGEESSESPEVFWPQLLGQLVNSMEINRRKANQFTASRQHRRRAGSKE